MKNGDFIPDSCIWINYFRRNKFEYGNDLEALIAEDKVCTCGLIISELISGAKSPKEVEIIEYSMGALNLLEVDYSIYIGAGKKRQILFSKGITIPLTDVLIAELCIKKNLHLITYDKHFLEFKKLFDLNLIFRKNLK